MSPALARIVEMISAVLIREILEFFFDSGEEVTREDLEKRLRDKVEQDVQERRDRWERVERALELDSKIAIDNTPKGGGATGL